MLYTFLNILLRIVAFPLALGILYLGILILEKLGFSFNPKKPNNRITFSLTLLTIFLIYFGLVEIMIRILDIFFNK